MTPRPPGPLIHLPGLLLAAVAAACAGNGPPSAETGMVTGTVAYRERMALPPDAVVRVQLSDVALQDAERYEFAGAFLLIHAKGMERPLRFTRHTP